MIKWLDSNPHTNLTKYITDHQEHTNNNAGKEKNRLINQGVKTAHDQYYSTHQKSILLNTVTESDIYDIQKVISMTSTVIPHVLTGRLRRHIKPI